MARITQLQTVKIADLKPYEKNAKTHPEAQLEFLEKSIRANGFLSPLLIDKDMNIIVGHGRTMAAKRAGLTEVPCVFVEGLTDEERRAFIISENKSNEMGGWDKDLLGEEMLSLEGLDFDTDLTGFDIDDFMDELPDSADYYGDERERTRKAYNLDIESEKTADFWQMPKLSRCDYTPTDLVGFNYAKTAKRFDAGIHFFLDDYQFERVWNNPEKYVDVLRKFECVLTPDFSLYTDMPMPMKIWNTYRSRHIGAFFQQNGLKVIPTVSWCEEESFRFCFEGIEDGSTVAVSTIGVKENDDAFVLWKVGMDAMISKINPSRILVYGGRLPYEFGGIEVVYYDNKVLERWKHGR